MQNYGSGYPAESQFYEPLLKKMWEEINEKKADLKKKNEEIADWSTQVQSPRSLEGRGNHEFQGGLECGQAGTAAAKENFDTRRKSVEEQEAEAPSEIAERPEKFGGDHREERDR